MVKKVYILYGDLRKPGFDIKNITGKNGFGDTIFKRLTLRERMKSFYEAIPLVEGFVDSTALKDKKIDRQLPCLLVYSDFVIADPDEALTIVNKALYAHESYKITQDKKIAAVIFESVERFLEQSQESYEGFTEIASRAFMDISEISNFRQFITSGFEARFFNSVSGDEYTVVKSSDNKEKLRAEYLFYGLLPEEMKQWFVRPFNFVEDEDKASYTMQRFHMTDLAIRYIHGSISVEECSDIFEKLFYFVKNRKIREVTEAEYEENARRQYVDKVIDRSKRLKESEGYAKIASLVSSLTAYKDIDEIVDRYVALYEKIRSGRKFSHVQVVAHGDMCFSNILFSQAASLLLLIDPKGATCEDELYMDPYYDLAKLSHSVCGRYDFFNSDLFEISVNEGLKAELTVYAENEPYVELFKNKLSENGIDFRLIRLYEASLFLSMLPLHMDRPRKVFAFILNAINILDELDES